MRTIPLVRGYRSEAGHGMGCLLKGFLRSYALPVASRRGRPLLAVHERRGADPYRASSTASVRPSAQGAPARHSPGPPAAPPVGLRLRPGQKGTKQLLAQYGDRLICVRYRYDVEKRKRFKTVDLVVAERDWHPPPSRFAPDQIVGLRVSFAEVALRDRVKRAGGTWNPERKMWQLRYDRAAALGLTTRTIDDQASSTGCLSPDGGHLHVDARAASR